jgi:hypothetical protein
MEHKRRQQHDREPARRGVPDATGAAVIRDKTAPHSARGIGLYERGRRNDAFLKFRTL